MMLGMKYGDFKPHEADAFELDHAIAYKQSLKCFDGNQPRKLSTSQITRYTVTVMLIVKSQQKRYNYTRGYLTFL